MLDTVVGVANELSSQSMAVPRYPTMVELDGQPAPAAPIDAEMSGVHPEVLADLALKLAFSVPHLSTEWAAQRLHLPMTLAHDLLDGLKTDHFLEVLGQQGPFNYRYAITRRGEERASRLMQVCSYVGPAPVSLESYTAMIEWQTGEGAALSADRAQQAVSELTLPEQAVETAALAVASRRSLFLFGPPGNGKTTLGRLLHSALQGELWIPYCVNVDNQIIRIFDPHHHQPVRSEERDSKNVDRRWVRVQPPLIVAGGELTIEALDLIFSPSVGYYEAPVHVKANGGMLLLDDFGRQRVDPHDLLNRWIIPLEHGIDHLTLRTGQTIQVPFRQILVVATNLELSKVTDPAFLRRVGYRVFLDNPTSERYRQIFERYASRLGLAVPPGLIDRLLQRYRVENRELRCCEPRDLLERVQDICRMHGEAKQLTDELLNRAWVGYFGNQ